MDIRTVLAESTLFSCLSPQALDALVKQVTVCEISGGQTLFAAGEPGVSLYTVASGRMRAILPDGTHAGDIGRGDPIGEIGLLTGEPRGATVYAVRDSELLMISRENLSRLIQQFPDALLQATRIIIRRLQQNRHEKKLESVRRNRVFAVMPASPDVDARSVARRLHQSLLSHGEAVLLDAATVDAMLGRGIAQTIFSGGDQDNTRLMAFLNEQEAINTSLIYIAGPQADAWARRCMRQADVLLVVANADTKELHSPMLEELKACGTRAHIDLLVLRQEGRSCENVLAWREQINARTHYYLRPEHEADMASLARQITGRGIGLVLGGGGARGFAHIGLLRALHELGIPVDIAGGSSMGAFFAALAACNYDHHEMRQIARETFVSNNYLNDYLFPTIAMIRGRKFVRRLRDIFGDRAIEQLPVPFFCVSTNLTRGVAMVHDRGPLHLWLATSMAVPGVAPPIAYQGELLADGAVVNSLPTDVMQNLERGPIIASDVSTEGGISAPGVEGPDPEGLFKWSSIGKRPSLLSIIFRTATLTSESGVAARAARADVYIRMPVTGIGLFDWKKLDEVSERAYRHALEKLEPIKHTLLK